MAGRSARRSSTPRVAFWGLLLFLLGLGVGALVTSQGCPRRHRLPGEEEPVPSPGERAPSPRERTPGTPRPNAGQVRPDKASEPPPEPTGEPQTVPPSAQPPAARPSVPQGEQPPQAAQPLPGHLPLLALVIDDLGYAPPDLVTRLCALPVPFDVAVLPYQEFSHQSAQIAHARGKEVMLHLPMEPKGYPGPGKDPGPNAILYDLSEAQVRERVRKALADIPFRRGVNNHMGSRITPDQARMTWVLEEIKASHAFFVDSRTEKDSVAFDVARDLAVPTVQRKVFLDDDRSPAESTRQWRRALALARSDGQVLIIGHIYPETVALLEKLVPEAQGQVTFVPASALAR
jgi:polysaccharide deacetylase 2 family uncharacterized protein YibQ